MANKSFTVQYLIKARDLFTRDANKAAKALGGIDKQGKKANDTLKKTSKQSSIAAKSFKKAGAAFKVSIKSLAGFAIGALGGLAGIVNVGARFETAMADMSSITGATGKDLEFFRNETKRLGKESIKSSAQVATAFKLVASAKSELLDDPKALSNVTEQVLLLSNAAGIDLSTAATITTQSLNQYSAGADQAAEFVNVLAAGSKIGASEVNETGVAIAKSATVAKDAGLGFEELNAAIQVLAKNGQKAELAGTGLKTVLLNLESQTNNRIKPSIVGFTTALENLKKMNLTTTQKSKLFGKEAITIGNILINNSDLVGRWTKELTGTNIAAEQAATRNATFSKQLEKIGIIIKNKLIDVFIKLSPMLTDMATKFGVWADSISKGDIESFSNGLKTVLNVAKEIGKVFAFVFEVIGKIIKLISLVGQAGTELIGLFGNDESTQSRSGGRNRAGALKAGGRTDISNKVDVGVQVGLDQGLKQTAATKTSRRARRTDTGGGFAEVPA